MLFKNAFIAHLSNSKGQKKQYWNYVSLVSHVKVILSPPKNVNNIYQG